MEIKSEPKILDLALNQSRIIMMDNETLELTLKEIRGRVVFIEFEKLQKPAPIGGGKPVDINKTTEEPIEEEATEEPQGEVTIEFPEEERKINVGLIIAVSITIIGLIIYFIIAKKRKKKW